MGRITTSDLHGYLIDERSSGSLSEIPATLYEEIQADMIALRAQAAASDDPFGEGAQSLIKERESLREYLRDLYAVRTQKILNLALARANGDEIDRSELQMMVPGERALFEVVFDSGLSSYGKHESMIPGLYLRKFVPVRHPVADISQSGSRSGVDCPCTEVCPCRAGPY